MKKMLKLVFIATMLLLSVSCYENTANYEFGMVDFQVEFYK